MTRISSFIAAWSVVMLFVGCVPAVGQVRTNVANGETLPATCRSGDVYVKRGSGAGFYSCDAFGAWQSSGGGSVDLSGTSDTQVLFNSSGAIGGDADLIFNGTRLTSGVEASLPAGMQGWWGEGHLSVWNDDPTKNGLSVGSNGKNALALLGYAGAAGEQAVAIAMTAWRDHADAAGTVYGSVGGVYITAPGTSSAYGFSGTVEVDGVNATNGYSFYADAVTNGGIFTNFYGFYAPEILTTEATNSYYAWFDSRGVYRVREDATFDAVGQAIAALYNPQFTKYTPGATNYERCIPGCQWNGNVAEFGTEEGGTGTLRPSRIIGANVSIVSALTPAVSNTSANSCGTTAATLVGNDNAGKVTVGATAGTSCTVTFATAFSNAPSCSVSNETTANLSRTTSTTTTVVLAGTFAASDVLAYVCVGR